MREKYFQNSSRIRKNQKRFEYCPKKNAKFRGGVDDNAQGTQLSEIRK